MSQVKRKLAILSLITGEKKFLINFSFQIQFMASLIIISVVSLTIVYIANDYFFQSYLQKGRELNLSPDHPFFLMIHEQKLFMAKVFIGVASSISAISCLWGLFYSHKIAGPLWRLEKYFLQAAKDNAKLNQKIYFRENDFFQEIPESINRYIDSMKTTSASSNDEKDAA